MCCGWWASRWRRDGLLLMADPGGRAMGLAERVPAIQVLEAPMNDARFWVLLGAAVFLGVLAIVIDMGTEKVEACAARGGIEVRASRGYVCIKAEVLK